MDKRRSIMRKKSDNENTSQTFTNLQKRRVSFGGKKAVREFSVCEAVQHYNESYEVSDHNSNLSAENAGSGQVTLPSNDFPTKHQLILTSADKENKLLKGLDISPLYTTFDFIDKTENLQSRLCINNTAEVTLLDSERNLPNELEKKDYKLIVPVTKKLIPNPVHTPVPHITLHTADEMDFSICETELNANDIENIPVVFKADCQTIKQNSSMKMDIDSPILENPKYILKYKEKIENSKIRVSTRDDILRKTIHFNEDIQIDPITFNNKVAKGPKILEQLVNEEDMLIKKNMPENKFDDKRNNIKYSENMEVETCGMPDLPAEAPKIFDQSDIEMDRFISRVDLKNGDQAAVDISDVEENTMEVFKAKPRQTIIFQNNDIVSEMNVTMDNIGNNEDEAQNVTDADAVSKGAIPKKTTEPQHIMRKLYKSEAQPPTDLIESPQLRYQQNLQKEKEANNKIIQTEHQQIDMNIERETSTLANNIFNLDMNSSRSFNDSSLLIPRELVHEKYKKMNLKELNAALEKGEIQIPSTNPKTPTADCKALVSKLFSTDKRQNHEIQRQNRNSRCALNFSDEIPIKEINLDEAPIIDTPTKVTNQSPNLDIPKNINKKSNYRFSKANEELLNDTSFLMKVKLGDETGSRNASKCSQAQHGDTMQSSLKTEHLLMTDPDIEIEKDENKADNTQELEKLFDIEKKLPTVKTNTKANENNCAILYENCNVQTLKEIKNSDTIVTSKIQTFAINNASQLDAIKNPNIVAIKTMHPGVLALKQQAESCLGNTTEEDSLDNKISELRAKRSAKKNMALNNTDEIVSPFQDSDIEGQRIQSIFEGTPHRSVIEFERLEAETKQTPRRTSKIKHGRNTILAVSDMQIDESGITPIENDEDISQIDAQYQMANSNYKCSLKNMTPNLPHTTEGQTNLFKDCDLKKSTIEEPVETIEVAKTKSKLFDKQIQSIKKPEPLKGNEKESLAADFHVEKTIEKIDKKRQTKIEEFPMEIDRVFDVSVYQLSEASECKIEKTAVVENGVSFINHEQALRPETDNLKKDNKNQQKNSKEESKIAVDKSQIQKISMIEDEPGKSAEKLMENSFKNNKSRRTVLEEKTMILDNEFVTSPQVEEIKISKANKSAPLDDVVKNINMRKTETDAIVETAMILDTFITESFNFVAETFQEESKNDKKLQSQSQSQDEAIPMDISVSAKDLLKTIYMDLDDSYKILAERSIGNQSILSMKSTPEITTDEIGIVQKSSTELVNSRSNKTLEEIVEEKSAMELEDIDSTTNKSTAFKKEFINLSEYSSLLNESIKLVSTQEISENDLEAEEQIEAFDVDDCAAASEFVQLVSDETLPQARNALTSSNSTAFCRKCKRCRESLMEKTNDTLEMTPIVMPPLREIPKSFERSRERLKKARQLPKLTDVLESYRRKSLERSFDLSNLSAEIDMPDETIPNESSAISQDDAIRDVLENYERNIEERIRKFKADSEVKLANAKRTDKFVIRLRKLLSEKLPNWIFNDKQEWSRKLEFYYTKTYTFAIIMTYQEKDLFHVNVEIKTVEFEQTKKEIWMPIDYLLDFQLRLATQFNLKNVCYNNDENSVLKLFQKLDEICSATHRMCFQCWSIVCGLQASLIRDNNNNSTVIVKNIRKVIQLETGFPFVKTTVFRIHVTNLKTLCYNDIISPPIYEFKVEIQCLPVGLDFLKVFLKDPVKYLKDVK